MYVCEFVGKEGEKLGRGTFECILHFEYVRVIFSNIYFLCQRNEKR